MIFAINYILRFDGRKKKRKYNMLAEHAVVIFPESEVSDIRMTNALCQDLN